MLALQQASLQPLPPGTRPVIAAVALVYFLGVGLIGLWAARRTRNARDFYAAGAGIGPWTLGIATMASTLSGFAFIGGPGLVYALGFGAVFIVLPASLTNTMGAWVLGKRLRLLGLVRGLVTIPEAIGARYRSPMAHGLSAVAILVATVGYTATNLLALGYVLDAVFGIGLSVGIWMGTLVVLGYSVAGGILAGVYTDLFQGTLMMGASLLVFVFAARVIGDGGGLVTTVASVDPAFLEPWGRLTPLAALSFFFVFGLGTVGQPHLAHKFYMLEDPRRLRWYPLIMTGALTVTLLLFVSVGLAVKSVVSSGVLTPLGAPDEATPLFLLYFTPLALAALVFSGVAAAVMSTVNSFLNIAAAAATHDLPVAFGRRPGGLARGRYATAIVAVLAGVVAHASGTLVAFLGIFGWGLFASTLVPALAIGLNWQGATRAGAIASIATGLTTTLALETLAWFGMFTLPGGVTVAAFALVLSLLVFFSVSWATRSSAERDLDSDIRAVMET